MNRYPRICGMLLGGCFALPVVAVAQQAVAPAPASSTHAPIPAPSKKPQLCFSDLFSGPLPGKSDYCLGMLHWHKGDYDEGLQMLKLAAGWGSKGAQYTLGLIYYGGRHVPADIPLGLAWLKLANERNNDDQITRVLHSATKWATAAQRKQAEQLFASMVTTYGDKVAGARAWEHLQHWRRTHDRRNSGCVRIYGAQAAALRHNGLAGMPPSSINAMLEQYRNAHVQASSGICVTLRMRRKASHVESEKYFAGTVWTGTVTVAPLQQVPAPSTSSGR